MGKKSRTHPGEGLQVEQRVSTPLWVGRRIATVGIVAVLVGAMFLGMATPVAALVDVDVTMYEDAVQVAAGGRHTCALLESGNVHCWGRNFHGQSEPYNGGDATQVAAGNRHTCALLESGNVHCWGRNSSGQSEPYNGGDATQVTAGNRHTCALLESGNVHCWGYNFDGQSEPYNGGDATQVTAGTSHTCALLDNGNVHCWGANGDGQSEPYNGGDATQVTAGGSHTCALLDNGNVHCWGDNGNGQAEPYNEGDVTQITAGGRHTCALLENGNGHCWGSNSDGRSEPYSPLDPTEGFWIDLDVRHQSVVVEGANLTVPGVRSNNVTTPELFIPETCVPIVLCVGPFTIPAQNVTQTPVIEEENVTVPTLVNETTPIAGAHIDVAPIEGVIDPLGPPLMVGPVNVTVPTPFGPFPISLCPKGCPVPATVGDASLETSVTVTIWVDDEEHSHTVPVEL